MLIELSERELEIIHGWYVTAAQESASGMSLPERGKYFEQYSHHYDLELAAAKEVKAVVDKLGFKYDPGDEHSLRRSGLIE